MKNISIILILILGIFITILSITGLETDRFNEIISQKIIENNNKVSVKLQKIKFKIDIKKLSLFVETNGPTVIYKNIEIPIKNVKAYLDLTSFFSSKINVNKIVISSKELNIQKLKRILIKVKPSNLNSLVINRVNKGKLFTEIELYLNKKQEISNIITRGKVRELELILYDEIKFKNSNFDFFADNTDILIKNINGNSDGIFVKNGNLQINKGNEINFKSDFDTKLSLSDNNISSYLLYLNTKEILRKKTIVDANIKHFLDFSLDKTFKLKKYSYKNKGEANQLIFTLNNSIKSNILEKDIDQIYFKNITFNTNLNSRNQNELLAKGLYSFKDNEFKNFDIVNKFSKQVQNIILNIDFNPSLNIEFLNYKKENDKASKIYLNLQKKGLINVVNELKYTDRNNLISIKKLKLEKKKFISLEEIKVKTYKDNKMNNNFEIDFGKEIKIFGEKFDATNLNRYLNQSSNNNNLRKINKKIDIDLKSINTPLSKKLKNFKLIGKIEKGKFVKISSKGDFGNDKFLDISLRKDKNSNKKYLEIYSDLPQPLLSEYDFFKGLSDGILTFTSIIDDNSSISKLIIENFKVKDAPGLIKLLSLADFGGLADLAKGEGLSFSKMEIQMSNDKNLLKLNELYAVGPSISVLMEGYKDKTGLISLRGTLVPAKNLNKFLSKIPVIGDIIIPKQIGEGLFGISFKIKGLPGKTKTTINPIKTLTPRFITKALEKSKSSK